MVKRTGEVVMGIIGIVLSALFSIIGIVFSKGMNSPDIMSQLQEEMENNPDLQGSGMTSGDMNSSMDIVGSMGSYLVILGIIASILGIMPS